MDNSIFVNQNDSFILQCQLAQRNEYSQAKKQTTGKAIFALTYTLIAVISAIANKDWLTALACLLGVALVVYNKHADKYINSRKNHAAAIQQYIDATLFAKVLGRGKAEWGSIPSDTDISGAASKYENKDTSEVQNWYSDYSKLSGELQIFHCQRENVRWNRTLHKKYQQLQIGLLIAVALALLIVFLAMNPNFTKLICILSWFASIAEYLLSNYLEVRQSASLLQKAEQTCDAIEKKLPQKDTNKTRAELIELQNSILEIRKSGFLIPDWFYKNQRDKQQASENRIAKRITTLDRAETSGN